MEDIGGLFQQSLQEASLAASCAREQQHAFDKALELRINLQKVLDSAHRLPVEEAHEAYAQEAQVQEGFEQLQQSLATLLDELTGALKGQLAREEESESEEDEEEVGGKRKTRSSDEYWENISELREQMQPKWETTVNSWHARVHFGSETTKNKLKMFNQTIWEQIDGALENQDRVIEKSRMLRTETKVFGAGLAEIPIDADSHDAKYDLEVYDDRAFYQMLLKVQLPCCVILRVGCRSVDILILVCCHAKLACAAIGKNSLSLQ